MRNPLVYILLLGTFVLASGAPALAQVEISRLSELVGWTVLADTNIQGEFEGPDFDKVVKLDNGWIIEFHDYDYFYEYHPEIVIFARQFHDVTLYRVLIDGGDDVYSVTRVR